MITAIDTNILLDVLISGSAHAETSEQALDAAASAGALIVSEIVYAELAHGFRSSRATTEFLESTGIRLVSSSDTSLHRGGVAWRTWAQSRERTLNCARCGTLHDVRCSRCGEPLRSRQHVLADFLIGAHAEVHADRLLTRDHGFYRRSFPELRLV